MNKRYFYTDPLAAAWMSKHFGMEFESPVLRNDIPFIDLVQMIAIGMTNPIVIKEENLPILEPQIGDIVLAGIYHDDVMTPAIYPSGDIREIKIHRVIQRNGKAFHWPESEEL